MFMRLENLIWIKDCAGRLIRNLNMLLIIFDQGLLSDFKPIGIVFFVGASFEINQSLGVTVLDS